MIKKYAKAFVAGALALLTSLQAGLDDNTITTSEWIAAVIAGAVAFAAVRQVPNKEPASAAEMIRKATRDVEP